MKCTYCGKEIEGSKVIIPLNPPEFYHKECVKRVGIEEDTAWIDERL